MGHTMFSSKAHKLENRLDKEARKATAFDWEFGESEHHDIHRSTMLNRGRKNYAGRMSAHMGATLNKKKMIDKTRAKKAVLAKRKAEDHDLDDKSDARHAGVHNETYKHKAHDETVDTHKREHNIEKGYDNYKFEDPQYGESQERRYKKYFGDVQGRHKEIHSAEERHDERDYLEKVPEHKNYSLSGVGLVEHYKESDAKRAADKKPSETTTSDDTLGEATYTESQKEYLKPKPKATATATVSTPTTVSSSSRSRTTEVSAALSRSRSRRRERKGLTKQTVPGTSGGSVFTSLTSQA